jgi:predicted nucleic acid-binding protein
LSRCILSGDRVIISAIVYYELKRELLRAKKTAGIARLDAFVRATPGRYLPLSDEALRLAAELWSRARQAGQPTSDRTALDIDVILAAQALSFAPAPSDVIVATTNAKHFTQFISARDWTEIVP